MTVQLIIVKAREHAIEYFEQVDTAEQNVFICNCYQKTFSTPIFLPFNNSYTLDVQLSLNYSYPG